MLVYATAEPVAAPADQAHDAATGIRSAAQNRGRSPNVATIRLRVNGASHSVDIDDPTTPLLYVLRNDVGLEGPRFGCGLGQCGACTVIIEGKAVRSCITPTSSVKSEITTLEGISKEGALHPLQQAWIDEQVPQC